jgi:ABC-type antimicrobial peptide transport system permease subunit
VGGELCATTNAAATAAIAVTSHSVEVPLAVAVALIVIALVAANLLVPARRAARSTVRQLMVDR